MTDVVALHILFPGRMIIAIPSGKQGSKLSLYSRSILNKDAVELKHQRTGHS